MKGWMTCSRLFHRDPLFGNLGNSRLMSYIHTRYISSVLPQSSFLHFLEPWYIYVSIFLFLHRPLEVWRVTCRSASSAHFFFHFRFSPSREGSPELQRNSAPQAKMSVDRTLAPLRGGRQGTPYRYTKSRYIKSRRPWRAKARPPTDVFDLWPQAWSP